MSLGELVSKENYCQYTKNTGNRARLFFKGIKIDSKGYQKHIYRSSESDCKNCPLRFECCGKVTKFKKIDDSIHKPFHDRMHAKLNKNKFYTRLLSKRRSSTVEPVLGTLINHHNLKRLNTRGMAQANKHVLMASLCYNLKKYLKFTQKHPQIIAQTMAKTQRGVQNLKSLFVALQSFNISSSNF